MRPNYGFLAIKIHKPQALHKLQIHHIQRNIHVSASTVSLEFLHWWGFGFLHHQIYHEFEFHCFIYSLFYFGLLNIKLDWFPTSSLFDFTKTAIDLLLWLCGDFLFFRRLNDCHIKLALEFQFHRLIAYFICLSDSIFFSLNILKSSASPPSEKYQKLYFCSWL